MNVQYAIKNGDIYVLEVNPRASRTVPFVAKVIGLPVAKIAARVMAGESLASFKLRRWPSTSSASIMSASRRRCSRSPGSATGRHRARPGDEIDRRGHGHRPLDYEIAFVKSQLGGGPGCRATARCSSRCAMATSRGSWRRSRTLISAGLQGHRHRGTQRFLAGARRRGRPGQQARRRPATHRRCHQKRPGSARFQHHRGGQALADSKSLRRAALLHKVPYYTTLSGAVAAAQGIKAYLGGDLEVRALQSYFGGKG